MVDELTGLYNRRGFTTLINGHQELSRATSKGFLLILADLDGLKQINTTDAITRIVGGDEFAIIAVQANPESEPLLINRIDERLRSSNAKGDRPYHVSLSLESAYSNPANPVPLDQLLRQADEVMYARKQDKKRSASRV